MHRRLRRCRGSLILALCLLCLAGRSPSFVASVDRKATPLGGCTDTWTGAAGSHDYNDLRNWSGKRVPGNGDFACVRPGAMVEVDRPPLEQSSSLVVEGTLCADDNVQLSAVSANTFLGTPTGRQPLPQMTGTGTPSPPCPAGATLSYQAHPSSSSAPDDAGIQTETETAPVAPPATQTQTQTQTQPEPAAPAPPGAGGPVV